MAALAAFAVMVSDPVEIPEKVESLQRLDVSRDNAAPRP
jgi:hypothetical protein